MVKKNEGKPPFGLMLGVGIMLLIVTLLLFTYSKEIIEQIPDYICYISIVIICSMIIAGIIGLLMDK